MSSNVWIEMEERVKNLCADHAASCASACNHLVNFVGIAQNGMPEFMIGSHKVMIEIGDDWSYAQVSNYLVLILGEETKGATPQEKLDAMINRYKDDPSIDIGRYIPGYKRKAQQ